MSVCLTPESVGVGIGGGVVGVGRNGRGESPVSRPFSTGWTDGPRTTVVPSPRPPLSLSPLTAAAAAAAGRSLGGCERGEREDGGTACRVP